MGHWIRRTMDHAPDGTQPPGHQLPPPAQRQLPLSRCLRFKLMESRVEAPWSDALGEGVPRVVCRNCTTSNPRGMGEAVRAGRAGRAGRYNRGVGQVEYRRVALLLPRRWVQYLAQQVGVASAGAAAPPSVGGLQAARAHHLSQSEHPEGDWVCQGTRAGLQAPHPPGRPQM